MERMKKYFVSYYYWGEGTRQGIASTQLEIEGPVKDWDSIQAMMAEIIRINPDYKTVSLLNWRRFEDPE
jgi:hypothetical protein